MSETDPWAVASAPAHDQSGDQYPETPAARPATDRIPRWIAMTCFGVIVVLNITWAIQPMGTPATDPLLSAQHEFDFPGVLADNSVFFLSSLMCVVLLALPRTRAFATGFGIGFSALWFFTVFIELRVPHGDDDHTALSAWSVTLSQALALPALICLVWTVLREARPAPVQPPALRLRRQRRVVLLLGLVAAAVWIVGRELAWARLNDPLALAAGLSPTTGSTCCTFSHVTGYQKADLISDAVALLILVVIAATGRSAYRGAGILAGLVIKPLGLLLVVVVQVLFPLQYLGGLQNPAFSGVPTDDIGGFLDTYSPLIGFWLVLFAVCLLAFTGPLLAVTGRRDRRARLRTYPALTPYGAPVPVEQLTDTADTTENTENTENTVNAENTDPETGHETDGPVAAEQ
jgi:hypothetical protein